MSIEAALEVKKGEYLPLEDGVIASKSIASFCTAALTLYCASRANSMPNVMLAAHQDLVEWFSVIAAHMTTDVCLLSTAVSGFWDYSANEYARYVEDTRAYLKGEQHLEDSAIKLLSQDEFMQACVEDEQAWTDTILLSQTVNDLIHVFDEIHPPEAGWYAPEITPVHFRALAKTLALAAEKGDAQVRLNCE